MNAVDLFAINSKWLRNVVTVVSIINVTRHESLFARHFAFNYPGSSIILSFDTERGALLYTSI